MRALATTLALAVLAWIPSAALAAQSVKLTAAFTPDRLNSPTTISFGFVISSNTSLVPSPVTGIDLHYPLDIGLATNELGLATCQPLQLELNGPSGCPANSRVGHGTALGEIGIENEVIQEEAEVTLLAGPVEENHLDFLVYALAHTPLQDQIIFSSLLIPEAPPYGARLHFDIPSIPIFPEGPNVSITRLKTTIGPLGITYYEHKHHHIIPYKPSGILLPPKCPHGGFPFTADLTFQDDTHTHATTTVGCPQPSQPRRGHVTLSRTVNPKWRPI